MSTTCSTIRNDATHFNRELLPGGVTILTLNHWASKVVHRMEDHEENKTLFNMREAQ